MRLTLIILLFFVGLSANAQSDSTYTSLEEAIKAGLGVKILILKRQKLTEFPMEILRLKNLEKLDLSKNKITTIPVEITNLTKLQYLDLSRNKIDTLPKELGELSKLKKLKMHHNSFRVLPESMGGLSELEYLDVDFTNISNIPTALENCKKLMFFNARHSFIEESTMKEIRRILPEDCVKLFPLTCKCNS